MFSSIIIFDFLSFDQLLLIGSYYTYFDFFSVQDFFEIFLSYFLCTNEYSKSSSVILLSKYSDLLLDFSIISSQFNCSSIRDPLFLESWTIFGYYINIFLFKIHQQFYNCLYIQGYFLFNPINFNNLIKYMTNTPKFL